MIGQTMTVTESQRENETIIRRIYNEVSLRNDKSLNLTFSYRSRCLNSLKEFFSSVQEAFPDYKLFIDNIKVKGDKVMARYTISGTQMESFLGLMPTRQKMTVTGIDVFRLNNGEIIEYWDAAHNIEALQNY
jgi:predicted ester cyclase